jgi:hypothetical protein
MSQTFKKWLLGQGYQPSTAVATCLALRRLSRPYGLTGADTDKPHLRRYLSFVRSAHANPYGRSFLQAIEAMGINPVSKGWKKHGRRDKPLLSAAGLAEFRVQLRKEDDIGMLTALCIQSGLRVSKLLAMPLSDAIESYPLYERWLKTLQSPKVQTLHQIVSPTTRGAYRKMRLVVAHVAERLEVEADLDLLYKSRLQIDVYCGEKPGEVPCRIT